MFLKNKNISSKIKRSKVTDYAALAKPVCDISMVPSSDPLVCVMDVITTFIA